MLISNIERVAAIDSMHVRQIGCSGALLCSFAGGVLRASQSLGRNCQQRRTFLCQASGGPLKDWRGLEPWSHQVSIVGLPLHDDHDNSIMIPSWFHHTSMIFSISSLDIWTWTAPKDCQSAFLGRFFPGIAWIIPARSLAVWPLPRSRPGTSAARTSWMSRTPLWSSNSAPWRVRWSPAQSGTTRSVLAKKETLWSLFFGGWNLVHLFFADIESYDYTYIATFQCAALYFNLAV